MGRSCFSIFFSTSTPKHHCCYHQNKPKETYIVAAPFSEVQPPNYPPPAFTYSYYGSIPPAGVAYGQPSHSSLSKASGQLKCKKCQGFYDPKEEEIDSETKSVCKFHSGSYMEVKMVKQWSCCGDTKWDAPPCTLGKHSECKVTTQNILKYQQLESKYLAQAANKSLNQEGKPSNFSVRSSSDRKKEEKEEDALVDLDDVEVKEITDPLFFLSGPCLPKREEFSDSMAKRAGDFVKFSREVTVEGGKEYFKHVVKSTDTMHGLSIRYNVRAEHIRQINKLTRDGEIFSRSYLLVPFNGQQIKNPNRRQELDERKQEMKRMVKRFHKQTGCESEMEAKFYLDDSNFDYHAALSKYNEDTKWDGK